MVFGDSYTVTDLLWSCQEYLVFFLFNVFTLPYILYEYYDRVYESREGVSLFQSAIYLGVSEYENEFKNITFSFYWFFVGVIYVHIYYIISNFLSIQNSYYIVTFCLKEDIIIVLFWDDIYLQFGLYLLSIFW